MIMGEPVCRQAGLPAVGRFHMIPLKTNNYKQMKLTLFLLFVVVVFQTIAQQNIVDVRRLSEGETATISGIITNGDELGAIRYIQDTTTGLYILKIQTKNNKFNSYKILKNRNVDICNYRMGWSNIFCGCLFSSKFKSSVGR